MKTQTVRADEVCIFDKLPDGRRVDGIFEQRDGIEFRFEDPSDPMGESTYQTYGYGETVTIKAREVE